MKDEMKIHC